MRGANFFLIERDRLKDLAESSLALENFNEMSKEHIVQVKKVASSYCKRIRKIRENLYKTFERIK